MEEFLKLPWNSCQREDKNLCFVDDDNLKKYSSTYKILHGNLQQIFSGDSSSDTDDAGTQKKERSEENDFCQRQSNFINDTKRSKKSNLQPNGYGRGQYVPCYTDEGKVKYPKKSSLSAEQQALYLQLMIKFAKKHTAFLSPKEQKELEQYEVLHDKVSAERFEFINFVKQRCAMTQDRYLLINPDVKKYIEELWQHRLSRVFKYPADYEPLKMLPLVYSDNKKPLVMKMEGNLLEVGSIPLIILPKLKNPVYVPTDYSKMRARFLPEYDGIRNIHKIPVSEDEKAESFAVANGVHVVISSSGLKYIADNHPPNFEKTWDLPVIVKEYTECENGIAKKVVYVDKALPPRSLTTVEKNLWYHKFGVKALMCNRKHLKCFQLESRELVIKDAKFKSFKESYKVEGATDMRSKHNSMSDSNACETNVSDNETDFSKIIIRDSADVPVNSSKRKHDAGYSDSECDDSDATTDTENRLVIDCSDTDKSSKKKNKTTRSHRKNVSLKSHVNNNNNVEDTRVTRSKARLIARMSSVNQSLGQKPIHFVTNRDHEIDDTDKTDGDCDVENSLKNAKVSGCLCPKVNAHSIVGNKMSGNTVVSEGGHINSCDVHKTSRNRQDFSLSKSCSTEKLTNVKSGVQEEKIKEERSIPPVSGSNVSYRLWKLCKDESQKDDLKEGFLKGECNNRELKVLVRCKVDGHEVIDDKIQCASVVPKMEYQTEYGAECLTQSELTHQWISLYIRPGADLCRVRVNACTSEIMMVERRSLQEVAQDNAQQLGRPNSMVLGTLYNVLLGLVDLDPGNYLLSHTPKLGAFVNLRQSIRNGRFKLHDMYKIDPKAASAYESSLWIPIDHSIVTPFHKACNRVPGTFPPTLFVRGKPLPKKKNKKKNNKKKNKNRQQQTK